MCASRMRGAGHGGQKKVLRAAVSHAHVDVAILRIPDVGDKRLNFFHSVDKVHHAGCRPIQITDLL